MDIAAIAGRTPAGTECTLVVGTIVDYENRLWRVGLVNPSRARLDPITGTVVTPSPASGRCFTSYGNSANVSPGSVLRTVEIGDLEPAAARRLACLVAAESVLPRVRANHESEEDDMAEEEVSNVSAAPVPAKSDRARLQKLRKAPKNSARPLGTKKVKTAKKSAAPAELKPCACGCGGKTAGYFIPGHDSKFKSWLLKLEKGLTALHGAEMAEGQERTALPKKVQEQYKWVKRGDGVLPTTNYKGEKHSGYAK